MEISEVGLRALHIAAMRGDIEFSKLLVKNGADLEAKTPYGLTAIQLAGSYRHPELKKFLLASKADEERRLAAELAAELKPILPSKADEKRRRLAAELEAISKKFNDNVLPTATGPQVCTANRRFTKRENPLFVGNTGVFDGNTRENPLFMGSSNSRSAK